jgi:hypothetical protein
MLKCLVPANYSDCAPGDYAASGSSLALPRAAADTQHPAPCHARAAEGGAGEEERRRDEGTGKGRKKSLGLVVVRQQGLG